MRLLLCACGAGVHVDMGLMHQQTRELSAMVCGETAKSLTPQERKTLEGVLSLCESLDDCWLKLCSTDRPFEFTCQIPGVVDWESLIPPAEELCYDMEGILEHRLYSDAHDQAGTACTHDSGPLGYSQNLMDMADSLLGSFPVFQRDKYMADVSKALCDRLNKYLSAWGVSFEAVRWGLSDGRFQSADYLTVQGTLNNPADFVSKFLTELDDSQGMADMFNDWIRENHSNSSGFYSFYSWVPSDWKDRIETSFTTLEPGEYWSVFSFLLKWELTKLGEDYEQWLGEDTLKDSLPDSFYRYLDPSKLPAPTTEQDIVRLRELINWEHVPTEEEIEEAIQIFRRAGNNSTSGAVG